MASSPRAVKLTILKGHKILVLGFSTAETIKLESAAANLGASIFKDFRKDLACIIARTLDNSLEPFDAIRKAILNQIPMISPRWLVDCSTSKAWVAFDDHYRLCLFHGMIATCSGYNPEEMTNLRHTIQSHGGVFDRNLVKGSTSHLLLSVGRGSKFESAMNWGGIVIVTPAWLQACIEAGYWVSAESFFPPSSSPPSRSPLAADITSNTFDPHLAVNSYDQSNDEMGVEMQNSHHEDMPPPPPLPRNPKQPARPPQPQPQPLPEFVNMLDQHLINLLISSSSSSQHPFPSPKQIISKDCFAGQVLFIDGHATVIQRYLSALFLHAGGFVAAVLDEQSVQYVILGPAAVEEAVKRRIALMPNVQYGNLLWMMDLLLPREIWQHLLPSPYNEIVADTE